MAEIKDFGEKIGGARKDMWALRGLIQTDLAEMNELERENHVKKDNIWIRPNWEKVIADGTPQVVAYWQNKMRQAIPPKPPANTEESQLNYVEIVGRIRDAVMAVKEPREIDNFYETYLRPAFIDPHSRGYYVTIVPEAEGIVNNKVLKAAQSKSWRMAAEAKKKLFGIPKDEKTYTAVKNLLSIYKYDGVNAKIGPDPYSDERLRLIVQHAGTHFYYLNPKDKFSNVDEWEKGTWFVVNDSSRKPISINFSCLEDAQKFVETFSRDAQALADKRESEKPKETDTNRKKAFVPPLLRHVQRTGPEYRGMHSVDSDIFLNELKFRAGEFGNWLSNDERQASLNMGYDAFRDLARVLRIRLEDITLNNSLAIAFGARGRGGANAAAAHYEPDRQVINLTKMSGAGCLAHEWGHAFDHAIGRAFGSAGLASEMKIKTDLPESFKDLLRSMKYKTVTLAAGEVNAEQKGQVDRCRTQLSKWIAAERPKNLTDEMSKKWDEISGRILSSSSSITGAEYMSFGRRSKEVVTNPDIEMLSQIRKLATNHSIPKDTKQQIVIWASALKSAEEQLKSQEPVVRQVKTDFYKGAEEFDKLFARGGHGYWKSDCEMFARAFDCYVADKIKEEGHKSQYLTAHADSFVTIGSNGETISAVPKGDEREMLNKKFDALFADLKERGILQDYVEEFEAVKPHEKAPSQSVYEKMQTIESTERSLYTQMSFDDLFAPASPEPTKVPPSVRQRSDSNFER